MLPFSGLKLKPGIRYQIPVDLEVTARFAPVCCGVCFIFIYQPAMRMAAQMAGEARVAMWADGLDGRSAALVTGRTLQ